MKTIQAAFTTAFLTGTFTLAGIAGAYNSGGPLLEGTAIGAAIGLLIGLGVVYPRTHEDRQSR